MSDLALSNNPDSLEEQATPEAVATLQPEQPVKVKRVRKKKYSEDAPVSPKLISESKDGRMYWISFPATDALQYIEELRATIPGLSMYPTTGMFQKPNDADAVQIELTQYWVPASAETLQAVTKFGKKHRFVFDGDIAVRAWATSEEGKVLEALSRAKDDTEIELPKMGGEPMPFQRAGVAYALRAKKCFIADEMGLGKTIQAIGAIAKAKAYPVLIVPPATLKRNWFREVAKWLPRRAKTTIIPNGKTIKMLHKAFWTGKKGNRVKKNWEVVIVNYDRIQNWIEPLSKIQWKAVIFDESHYLKNRNAKRTRAVLQVLEATKPEYIWMLTGTPIKNNPRELVSQLKVMGRLEDFGGRGHFITRYCYETKKIAKSSMNEGVSSQTRDAMIRKAHENLTKLNTALRSLCFIRRDKREVLKDLPDKTRTTVLFQMDKEAREVYKQIELDVVGWLSDQAAKDEQFLKSIKKLSKMEQEFAIAERRASVEFRSSRAEALVKLAHLKRAAANGVMPQVKQWVEDFLESDEKLIMFSLHRNMIQELENHFDGKVVTLTGGMGDDNRQNSIDRFNTDDDIKMISCTLPMGVGWTGVVASNVAFNELGWTPADHDQAEDRAHRYGQKDNVTCWYLLAEGTIMEKIAMLIEKKRAAVNSVSDGDPLKNQMQGSIIGDLVSILTGGKRIEW